MDEFNKINYFFAGSVSCDGITAEVRGSGRNGYGGELICNALCPKVCGVGDWELLCLREINF